MPDLAPILATKFDALRSVEMPGARLILFKEGTTSERKYVPISFGGTGTTGLVKRGWRVNPRRFDRFGEQVVQIDIARSSVYTSALLEQVAGFLVLPKGETSGRIVKCAPAGIAALVTEPVWRLRAEGRTNQPYPDVSAGTRFLEDGSARLLEDDSARNLEAA